MSPHTTTSLPQTDGAVRALGAVGLCGVALIHLLRGQSLAVLGALALRRVRHHIDVAHRDRI